MIELYSKLVFRTLCVLAVCLISACSVESDSSNLVIAQTALHASEGEEVRQLVYVNQGQGWTDVEREIFYTQDQGSRIMPLAWMKALPQTGGLSFLDDGLARYGFLKNSWPPAANLPVGFTIETQANERWVGMTCSACHSRQISVDGSDYRIDGGPALINLQAFLEDLDASVGQVAEDGATFKQFAAQVQERVALVDNAIWLLCADSGLHLTNREIQDSIGGPTPS